jgi:hypothetical protein
MTESQPYQIDLVSYPNKKQINDDDKKIGYFSLHPEEMTITINDKIIHKKKSCKQFVKVCRIEFIFIILKF